VILTSAYSQEMLTPALSCFSSAVHVQRRNYIAGKGWAPALLAKGLKTRASGLNAAPRNKAARQVLHRKPIERVIMLGMVSHHYGGTWVFYVITPVILFGAIACLWWIIRGATAVFGPGRPDRVRRMRRP
jgi:hypothetical protein